MNVIPGIAMLALGIALSLPADAIEQSRRIRTQGGASCQLSIPTTDTKVRPRATGMRNEGTTNAFVICGIPTPNGSLTYFEMVVQTIDGVNHAVSCTGVNGQGNINPVYVAKNANTGTNPNSYGFMSWNASDFGGTAGQNFPLGYFSATCNLPTQASISYFYVDYNEDVGN